MGSIGTPEVLLLIAVVVPFGMTAAALTAAVSRWRTDGLGWPALLSAGLLVPPVGLGLAIGYFASRNQRAASKDFGGKRRVGVDG